MIMPENDREVLIKLQGGREIEAYTADWLPAGAFVDENFNACGCEACASSDDTGYYFPVSWREKTKT